MQPAELDFIGKSVPRRDAVEKATGKAMFGVDFKVAGMLHARVLRSPHAHARVIRIDTSRAGRLPGVRAIITPDDAPPVSISPFFSDQYALCRDSVVRCAGEPVAAVAADTPDIAADALRLIKVEYEPLPAVFDVEEAFRRDPPAVVYPEMGKYKPLAGVPIRPDPNRPNVCQTYKIRCGDVEKGFREADLIVENRFTTSRIQHCQLEPHMAIAWFEADGGLTVRSSSQMANMVKICLGRLFGLPLAKVRVLTGYVGGGYGGKGGVRGEPIAALLAHKSGRPVGLFYTREEMFVAGGHRVPFTTYIKDGVKKDGTVVAREMRVMLAIGAYSDYAILIVRRAAAGVAGTYRVPNFKFDSYGVYTNLPLTGALRGFGCPEIEWPVEQQMDIIAEKLGLDPVLVRKRNILNEGERDVSGMLTRSIGVGECLDRVAEFIGWGESQAGTPVPPVGPWKRGKGIAIGNKSIIAGSTSVVIVKLWHDGTLEVRCTAAELGQGIETTLSQIAAQQFEIPIERVKIVSGDTAFCPFDYGTVASRTLVHNGNALIAACNDVKQQLFRMAARKLGAFDLAASRGKIYVKEAPDRSINISDLFSPMGVPLEGGEIIGRGVFTGGAAPEDPETGQSERSAFDYSHIATGVEVAVNTETGELKILRSAVACDVGRAINPAIVEGQIEGGHIMGAGSVLHEEVRFDRQGRVTNDGFRDYRIPGSLDVPARKDSKAIIVEVAEPEGPYGAKGVGELALIGTAPAIASAVFNAVGVRIKDLPLTREKILEVVKGSKSSKSSKSSKGRKGSESRVG
ncbi:MAG: xanthine dehydrogenase family protein molybdopterin-binding subunit [Chloroflexi bacterium]|nr:xanthine dehydrogenase family protein molybdopterin-binding subunit [Chloroflexota bacterium]